MNVWYVDTSIHEYNNIDVLFMIKIIIIINNDNYFFFIHQQCYFIIHILDQFIE